MIVQPERADPSVGTTKRFETVEDRLSIVQHGRGRLEPERLVGDHPRVVPPAVRVVLHHENVIREVAAEAERVFRRLGLEGRRLPDRDIERHLALPWGRPTLNNYPSNATRDSGSGHRLRPAQ